MIGKWYKLDKRFLYGFRLPSYTCSVMPKNEGFEWPELKSQTNAIVDTVTYSDIVNMKKLFEFQIVGELDKDYILEFDGGRKCLIEKKKLKENPHIFQEYKMDYLSKELFEI